MGTLTRRQRSFSLAAYATGGGRRGASTSASPENFSSRSTAASAAGGRIWKATLQRLSDDVGLRLVVYWLPPGTTKWTQIVERRATLQSQRQRGSPWLSRLAIVNLLGNAPSNSQPIIKAVLDRTRYATKIKLTDDEVACLKSDEVKALASWNWTISPKAE